MGVYQIDSVTIDIPKTISELETFWSKKKENINEIIQFLTQYSLSVVYSDINAISAFTVKKLKKIPKFSKINLIGSSNFTWDWIYTNIFPESHKNEQEREKISNFVRLHEKANSFFDLFLIMPFYNEDYFTNRAISLFKRQETEFSLKR